MLMSFCFALYCIYQFFVINASKTIIKHSNPDINLTLEKTNLLCEFELNRLTGTEVIRYRTDAHSYYIYKDYSISINFYIII